MKTWSFLSFLRTLTSFCMGLMLLSSCAYRFGNPDRALPNKIKSVAIPQFTNKTMETGIEIFFTNAMREEFQKAKMARITNSEYSEAIVEGTITGLAYTPGSKLTSGSAAPILPDGSVIAAEYRIVVDALIQVKDRSTGKTIWTGEFSAQTTYTSPQVTGFGLNTVDPLYNLSARRTNIQLLARRLVTEAYNRMTENF